MLHSIFTAQDLFNSKFTPSWVYDGIFQPSICKGFCWAVGFRECIITCETNGLKNAQLLVCWSFCRSRFGYRVPPRMQSLQLQGLGWDFARNVSRHPVGHWHGRGPHPYGIHMKRETIWVVEKENLGLFGLYLANDIFPVQQWYYHSNPGSTWPMG